jgi:hypothetical protein
VPRFGLFVGNFVGNVVEPELGLIFKSQRILINFELATGEHSAAA